MTVETTTAERVIAALKRRQDAGEPLSITATAQEAGITDGQLLDAVVQLRADGRLTFTGRSGSVPVLTVIEGGA